MVLPSGLPDRELAAALARVYVDERIDLRCGGVIFADAATADYNDVFTVGRLIVDGDDARSVGGVGHVTGHMEVDGGSARVAWSHVIAKFDF